MKNYLSFGGGVNSVAMYLLLMDQGMKPGDPDKGFEAVFVDHGTDWPETYEYVEMFKSKYPLTVLMPGLKENGKVYNNLYQYCWDEEMVPSRHFRWCTEKFKVRPIYKYVKTPCFMFLGFSFDEYKRAKISLNNGVENRFPLIEHEIDRQGCKDIITKHGLSIPMKSGCYICAFQRIGQWKQLRKDKPELFCKAEKLEQRKCDERDRVGKPRYYINKKPLAKIINENQSKLWADDEYPPCECML